MAAGDDPGAGDERTGGGFLAFWSSLPGVLTGLAAVLTAAIGLIGLWRSLDGGSKAAAPSGTNPTNPQATTTAESGSSSGVLADGRLTMRDEDTANLKTERVSTGDSEADLWLQGAGNPDFGIVYAPYGGMLSEADGVVDKPGCVTALTARSADRVRLTELKQGTTLCLKMHTGTIALLKVVSPPAIGSPQLVFDYTVWP